MGVEKALVTVSMVTWTIVGAVAGVLERSDQAMDFKVRLSPS